MLQTETLWNVSKSFKIVHRAMSDISWKFNEKTAHQFFHNLADRQQTNKPKEIKSADWEEIFTLVRPSTMKTTTVSILIIICQLQKEGIVTNKVIYFAFVNLDKLSIMCQKSPAVGLEDPRCREMGCGVIQSMYSNACNRVSVRAVVITMDAVVFLADSLREWISMLEAQKVNGSTGCQHEEDQVPGLSCCWLWHAPWHARASGKCCLVQWSCIRRCSQRCCTRSTVASLVDCMVGPDYICPRASIH